MSRGAKRAALFVDFDNVAGQISGSTRILNWMNWLEDGMYDPLRRRRSFLVKRIYWNAAGEVHREKFEQAGFEAFNCPSRVRFKKSAADMLIALEALEVAIANPKIEEFVVLTADSDFVPLLAKLSNLEFETAIVADHNSDLAFAVYQDLADFAIPKFRLAEAPNYSRTPPTFLERWIPSLREKRLRREAQGPREGAGSAEPVTVRQPQPTELEPASDKTLAEARKRAAAVVVSLGEYSPNPNLKQEVVVKRIKNAVGAKHYQGSGGFLGYHSYPKMMRALAGMNSRIKVRNGANGGVHVSVEKE